MLTNTVKQSIYKDAANTIP